MYKKHKNWNLTKGKKIRKVGRGKQHLEKTKKSFFNPIQDGIFRGCSWMGGGGQKGHPSLKSVSHILQWWNLAQLYLTKENPKNLWITWHTAWFLLTSAFFHWKSANFVISINTDIDWNLVHNFTFKSL